MLGEIDTRDHISPKVGVEATFASQSGGPSLDHEASAVVDREHAPSLDELVFSVVAAFRRHGHVDNVRSRISGGDWTEVEQALRSIPDPFAVRRDLSPPAQNIIDLMCADRGVQAGS